MKKESISEIQRFRVKFSVKIKILCALIVAFSIGGIVITVFRIRNNHGIHGFLDVLKFPLLIAICLFCIVLVASLLIKSEYTVEKDKFTTRFGFIKSKFPLDKITAIELDRDEHKLTVRYGEEFSVLGVGADWQENFASAIIKANPEIEYSYTLPQPKPEKKEKKKK